MQPRGQVGCQQRSQSAEKLVWNKGSRGCSGSIEAFLEAGVREHASCTPLSLLSMNIQHT